MVKEKPQNTKIFKEEPGSWGTITHFALFDMSTESAIVCEGEVLFPLIEAEGKSKAHPLK